MERTADFGNGATFIIGICLILGSMILRSMQSWSVRIRIREKNDRKRTVLNDRAEKLRSRLK
ncbi:MAG: hypothetical protein ACOX7K_07820 [Oscillospiraceae bacterium]